MDPNGKDKPICFKKDNQLITVKCQLSFKIQGEVMSNSNQETKYILLREEF